MGDEYYLTPEGTERLQTELEELTGPGRKELASRLRAAIQQGDLSENADYHKAKEDQAFLEGRIQELEHILRHVVIIEDKPIQRDIIEIGARVSVQEEGFDPEKYRLVGAKEANPRNGQISNESPIGRALLGHRVGDEVVVDTPNGQTKFKILNIA
jgi:transcription elongation factor GreA